jgi:hypothetical protein
MRLLFRSCVHSLRLIFSASGISFGIIGRFLVSQPQKSALNIQIPGTTAVLTPLNSFYKEEFAFLLKLKVDKG